MMIGDILDTFGCKTLHIGAEQVLYETEDHVSSALKELDELGDLLKWNPSEEYVKEFSAELSLITMQLQKANRKFLKAYLADIENGGSHD